MIAAARTLWTFLTLVLWQVSAKRSIANALPSRQVFARLVKSHGISESPGSGETPNAQRPVKRSDSDRKEKKDTNRIYDIDGQDINRKSVFHAFAMLHVRNVTSNKQSFLKIETKPTMGVKRMANLPKFKKQRLFRIFEATRQYGKAMSPTKGKPFIEPLLGIHDHLTTRAFFGELVVSLRAVGKDFNSKWHAKNWNCQHFLRHVLDVLSENPDEMCSFYDEVMLQDTAALLPSQSWSNFLSGIATGLGQKADDYAIQFAIKEGLGVPLSKPLDATIADILEPARAMHVCSDEEVIDGIHVFWSRSVTGAAVSEKRSRKKNNTNRIQRLRKWFQGITTQTAAKDDQTTAPQIQPQIGQWAILEAMAKDFFSDY